MIFLEPKMLYRSSVGDVPIGDYELPVRERLKDPSSIYSISRSIALSLSLSLSLSRSRSRSFKRACALWLWAFSVC